MTRKIYYESHREEILAKQKAYRSTPEVNARRNQRRREYTANHPEARRRKLASKKKWQAKLRAKLDHFLADKKCQTCPEARRPCMCFHHRDPATKKGEVSTMIVDGVGWERVLEEIDKCDILCHNCHAVLHDEERKKNRGK